MKTVSYGYVKTLKTKDFQEAIEQVTAALKSEGFGVLTEIDVKTTLKAKLDVNFRPYKILGACNPQLAHQALGADEHIGLLLPCNVVVQTNDEGAVEVAIADPKAMFTIVGDDSIKSVADEADARLQRVIDSLG